MRMSHSECRNRVRQALCVAGNNRRNKDVFAAQDKPIDFTNNFGEVDMIIRARFNLSTLNHWENDAMDLAARYLVKMWVAEYHERKNRRSI